MRIYSFRFSETVLYSIGVLFIVSTPLDDCGDVIDCDYEDFANSETPRRPEAKTKMTDTETPRRPGVKSKMAKL